MSFLSKYSDTPYNIYRCMHVPTGAFIFIRGAVNDPDERGVVRHIQQNLRRPVTSRSPEDRKVVAKFVESNGFDLSASGIDRDWVIQVVKTVPEHLIPVTMEECVLGARKAGKVVLNTLTNQASKAQKSA